MINEVDGASIPTLELVKTPSPEEYQREDCRGFSLQTFQTVRYCESQNSQDRQYVGIDNAVSAMDHKEPSYLTPAGEIYQDSGLSQAHRLHGIIYRLPYALTAR